MVSRCVSRVFRWATDEVGSITPYTKKDEAVDPIFSSYIGLVKNFILSIKGKRLYLG